jgi:hypothetical protein
MAASDNGSADLMSTNAHPTKFLVREYLERRAHDPAPPAAAVSTSNKRAMIDLVAGTKTDTIVSKPSTHQEDCP